MIPRMRLMEALRKNIKELRQERSWTQADLAQNSGFSKSHIAQVESKEGGTWVSEEFVAAMAGAFQVPETRLFRDPNLPLTTKQVIAWIRDAAGDAAGARYLAAESLLPKMGSPQWNEMTRKVISAREWREESPPVGIEPEPVRAAKPTASPLPPDILRGLERCDADELDEIRDYLMDLGKISSMGHPPRAARKPEAEE
jgi:transcriptional regulator with XRE-family HTH domain